MKRREEKVRMFRRWTTKSTELDKTGEIFSLPLFLSLSLFLSLFLWLHGLLFPPAHFHGNDGHHTSVHLSHKQVFIFFLPLFSPFLSEEAAAAATTCSSEGTRRRWLCALVRLTRSYLHYPLHLVPACLDREPAPRQPTLSNQVSLWASTCPIPVAWKHWTAPPRVYVCVSGVCQFCGCQGDPRGV